MLGLTSVSVFLFSALALSVSSGYSLGALVLLLASASLLWRRPFPALNKADRHIIAILILYFSVYTANMVFHHDPMRELDLPLRALLAIPVLLLLLAYPPKAAAWWSGIAVGAIGGTSLALWQFLIQDMSRPTAATSNAIHYGNVSMLLGLLSMCGIGWARQQRFAKTWTVLLIVGFLGGVTGSILSGSRGGWLALPICCAIYALVHLNKLNLRTMLVSTCILIALTSSAFLLPHSPVRERTEAAIIELQSMDKDPYAIYTSTGQRLQMWSSAFYLFQRHPVVGLGRTGYLEGKAELMAAGKITNAIVDYTNAHSDYVDALVKRGIIGLLCMLALLLVPLIAFTRALRSSPAARPYALSGIVLSASYLIFGLTTTSLTLNIGIMMLTFPMVILWSMLRDQQRKA